MEVKKGIPVSPGVAIAPAVVLDAEEYRITQRTASPDEVPHEQEHVDLALVAARNEVEELRDRTSEHFGRETAAIFDFHLGVLNSESFRQKLLDSVEKNSYTAAYAVSQIMHEYQRRFLDMREPVFNDRVKDVYDIEKRLLRHLLGHIREDLLHLSEPVVVIAHDLTPSQTAQLDRSKVLGFVTDAGGLTSHTAILARSVGIPAVVGLNDITSTVSGGDLVIIDGTKGLVICKPTEETLEEYEETGERLIEFGHELDELRDLPAETLDGERVELLGNIEFPHEVTTCLNRGAEGIGLYRTEFLYLRGETEPTEADHYEAYRDAIEALGGRPIVIRTLDLGADKYAQALGEDPERERNPFLGLRSIRLCLANVDIFKAQLRAILRASVLGHVSIMFPLISKVMELRQAKWLLAEAMEDLDEEGIEYRKDIRVGIMVETPSAVAMSGTLAREVDFFSIGTNDLIQYTLAVDRANERVAPLYTGADPAVIRFVRDVIHRAKRQGVDCSLCGEMAGDPMFTPLLLGLGLRKFSMAPTDIPEIKQIIRRVTTNQTQKLARRVLRMESDREIYNCLRDEMLRILPEAM
ncbi:MAG: phosphoenolpyruvate--protein phosphotransferase [Phycisphaerae bacterium]|nr:phosphoenolpyruvate--protein phosphotransferase [Phycisphaerae bacterium]